uniref:Uncharacterized protein n=1 Tax=viral metagenome TaxID=1070528 RepID=A0A6C0JEC1_9ZZZZ
MIGSFVDDIIFVGFKDIHTTEEWILKLLPLVNDIAHIFTIASGIPIYPHYIKNMVELIKRCSIDFLALTGIVGNAAYKTEKYSKMDGIVYSLALLFFGFLIPNFILEPILKKFPKSLKFIVGIIVIYGLEICIALVYRQYKIYKKNKISKAN